MPIYTRTTLAILILCSLFSMPTVSAQMAAASDIVKLNTADFEIKSAQVFRMDEIESLVFEITVAGKAGNTTPRARGELNGAPVLGYVFPTTLNSTDVGFGPVEGVVALAVTAHPDFDDTPLWDENNDRNYANDGIVFHTHWVVLNQDNRVPGGLSVVQFQKGDSSAILPPTNPGMPMYMDSPGYNVVLRGNTLRVIVPSQRIHHQTEFRFDAVTAYMEVSTAGEPLLGVYKVFSLLSGDLSLPYSVGEGPSGR